MAHEFVEAGTAGVAQGVSEPIRSMRGEPETVFATGWKMAGYGRRMAELADKLRAIKDADMTQWRFEGDAADKLRSSVDGAAEMLAVASALYFPIGVALSAYGSQTDAHQEQLNSLAVQCKEKWETLTSLKSEYRDAHSTASAPGAPEDPDAEQKLEQLESELTNAESEWNQAATSWNNAFVDWCDTYDQAVAALSDPGLEAIRTGEAAPGSIGLFPAGMPSASDVNQGGTGDCYLLAVLAGIAGGDPERILDMITVNDDGTYTVHFADGDITITADQIHDGNQALWVRIIEGAYQVHEGSYEEFDNGGRPEAVMRAIYGEDATSKDDDAGFWDFATGGNDIDDSYSEMEDALDDGLPVVADAMNGDLGFGDPQDGGGHALTVLEVYEDDGVKYVVVRNPWGHNRDHDDDIRAAGGELTIPPDGTFTMSMDQFSNSFSDVQIANR